VASQLKLLPDHRNGLLLKTHMQSVAQIGQKAVKACHDLVARQHLRLDPCVLLLI